MSKDGWLPPGVTDRDIDEASPGYWEANDNSQEIPAEAFMLRMQMDREDNYRESPDGLGCDEYTITRAVERMMAHKCKVDVMELFDKLMDRFRLGTFSK
jgi:hypothetical protein